MEWANQGGGVLDLLGKEGPRGRWRRGTRLGGTWVAPEGLNFSLQGFAHVSFCPEFHFHFHFHFWEWKWNSVLHHFLLFSMQQHVTRARAPKHVMRVEIYWEKKYRKGLLSITRSGKKIKNIMIGIDHKVVQILEKYSLFFISTLILSSFRQVSSVVGRGHTSSPLAADITHWPEERITNLEGSWPLGPQRTNRQSDWLVGILVHFDKNENNILKYEYEYDWIDQDLKK